MPVAENPVEQLRLGPPVGKGGESTIYSLPSHLEHLFKRYHHPTIEKATKLEIMLRRAPPDRHSKGRPTLAWPKRRVFANSNPELVVGFIMPKVYGVPVAELHHTKSRLICRPSFNWLDLLHVAQNIADVFSKVHASGYVIGDVNDGGVLVDDDAVASLVDCDSFQVIDDETGGVLRCPVGVSLFTPPELVGTRFATVNRSVYQDAFGLAVLVYELMMGCHPFSVRVSGNGEQPSIEDAIKRRLYPDSNPAALVSRASPSLMLIQPDLRILFRRAFTGSIIDRPSAEEWSDQLGRAIKTVATCRANSNHIFGEHLGSHCPWCEHAAALRGRDPFPSNRAIKAGAHIKHARPPANPVAEPAVAGTPIGLGLAIAIGLIFAGFWLPVWALFLYVPICLVIGRSFDVWRNRTAAPPPQSPTPPTQRSEVVTRDAEVIASRRQPIYHRLSCESAQNIIDRRRVTFPSRQAAERRGYRACPVCKPL